MAPPLGGHPSLLCCSPPEHVTYFKALTAYLTIIFLSLSLNHKPHKVRDHPRQSCRFCSPHAHHGEESVTDPQTRGRNKWATEVLGGKRTPCSPPTRGYVGSPLFLGSTKERYLVSTSSSPGWFPFIRFSFWNLEIFVQAGSQVPSPHTVP